MRVIWTGIARSLDVRKVTCKYEKHNNQIKFHATYIFSIYTQCSSTVPLLPSTNTRHDKSMYIDSVSGPTDIKRNLQYNSGQILRFRSVHMHTDPVSAKAEIRQDRPNLTLLFWKLNLNSSPRKMNLIHRSRKSTLNSRIHTARQRLKKRLDLCNHPDIYKKGR